MNEYPLNTVCPHCRAPITVTLTSDFPLKVRLEEPSP